jgi:hypothetical protein
MSKITTTTTMFKNDDNLFTVSELSSSATAAAINSSGKLSLQGDGADVEINGKSLTLILESLERHLGIVRPNPELEKEFGELKEIGDMYRAKEKELLEKRRVWETLKR